MISSVRDRRVFVDTSAYFAVADQDDASHESATRAMRQLTSDRRSLVTTNVVLFELHGLLTSRIDRDVAWRTMVAIRESQQIVRVRARDEDRAVTILEQYADRAFSFTDALSFAVMERMGMTVAFSLDRHFVQFGWQIVPL
jgi:predicted nucleic acid-binding protein